VDGCDCPLDGGGRGWTAGEDVDVDNVWGDADSAGASVVDEVDGGWGAVEGSAGAGLLGSPGLGSVSRRRLVPREELSLSPREVALMRI